MEMEEQIQNEIIYSSKRLRIAIDGLAGCCKSSLAYKLAKKWKLIYIDSGMIYRFVTFYFLRNSQSIEGFDMSMLEEIDPSSEGTFVYYKGKAYYEELLSEDVKKSVSFVAQNCMVRECINRWIREKTSCRSAVVVGRDIGSVVLADAELKIYLYASVDYRIRDWRKVQLNTKGYIDQEEEIRERMNIETRDYMDLHREIAPLICTMDAIKINVEEYDLETLFQMVSELYQQRLSLA